MWEWAIVLVGLLVVASVVLPVVAIIKIILQQKQIDRLQTEVIWLQQRVQGLLDAAKTPSTLNTPPSATSHAITTNLPAQPACSQPIAAQQTSAQVPAPRIPQAHHIFYPATAQAGSTVFRLTRWGGSVTNLSKSTVATADKLSKATCTSKPLSLVDATASTDESAPTVVTSLLASVKQWLFGENFIVRIGAIVLLVGVVLMLKLASQYIQVPIAVRMAMVALAGLVVTGIGYKTSIKRRGYGLTLQGVGFAMIYLTVFTSFRLYQLLPSALTFGLLAILAALTVLFSVWQNALPLAVLALGGAFLAPILVSQPNGSAVMLFGYYLLLNIAVAVIAHYRTWKLLNALSLAVTFGLAYVWGFGQYIAATDRHWLTLRWPLFGLLVAHIALYLFIAVRYTQQVVAYNQRLANDNPPLAKPLVSLDAGLLFGTALLGFGLMAALLNDLPYYLAVASGAMSAVYLATGFWLLKQSRQGLAQHDAALKSFDNSYQLLIEATLALGMGFLALVLPLALSATWLTIGWAVQGAALVWLGERTSRRWTIWFGLGLQVLSTLLILDFSTIQQAWFAALDNMGIPHQPAIDILHRSLPFTVVTVGLWISAYVLRFDSVKADSKGRQSLPLQYMTLWLAVLTVLGCIHIWVDEHVGIPEQDQIASVSYALICSGLLVLGQWLHEKKNWQALQTISRYVLPLVMLTWLMVWDHWSYFPTIYEDPNNPISPIGMAGYGNNTVLMLSCLAMAKILGLWLFWRWSKQSITTINTQVAWGLVLIMMMTLMLGDYPLMYFADHIADELPVLLQILPTILAVLVLMAMQYLPKSNPWANRLVMLDSQSLLLKMSVILIPLVAYWHLSANYHLTGKLLGFYLPFLNPLDILLIASLLYIAYVSHHAPKHRKPMVITLGVAAFVTVSSMLVRTFGAWMGTPTWANGAWQVATIQTGLTILWSMIATLCMFWASKQGRRPVWFAGVSLLTLVVFKLVLVDLSNTSAILRVVSFIVAGLLMLVIGYLAPLPPTTLVKHSSSPK